jgi:hypothetical protein
MDTAAKRPKTFGPVQFPRALGLARWEWERALADGLIPPAGEGGRWPAEQVDAALEQLAEIKAKIGDVCDLGSWQAAEVLAERLGVPVDRDAVLELARAGLIADTGTRYKGHRLYSGRSIAAFRDAEAFRAAAVVGRRLTSEQAADHMGIRRPDFEHLVRAGRVRKVGGYRGQWSSWVLLFRVGDLDALLADPAYDWPAIRATPRGRPSVLAKLPSVSPKD